MIIRWEEDRVKLQPVNGRPAYPYRDDEQRKVARDAYVSWQGSRYSVPWQYAGKEVWVREQGGDVEVRYGAERIIDLCEVVSNVELSAGSPASWCSGRAPLHI